MKVTLNNCIVYKANSFEKFASRFFPYHIPFISKRTRIKIKNYFKYRFKKRLMKDLVEQLKTCYISKVPLEITKIHWEDWEWEVIRNGMYN